MEVTCLNDAVEVRHAYLAISALVDVWVPVSFFSLLRGHHVVAFVPSIAVRLFQGLLHPLLSQAKFRSLKLEIACRL